MTVGGLDVGTSGCKLAVYDENGNLIDRACREYPSLRSADRQEIDADTVWGCVKETVAEITRKIKDISAIGVTSFGEAFVMLDENDGVLAPSMLYSDARGGEQAKLFNKNKVRKITGTAPDAMYSLPKLMWIKEHCPEIYEKARRILLFQDFIVYMLTGRAQIDYSLAARTMAFDIRKKQWSDPLFKAAGIDMSKMSRPVTAGTAAGRIRESLGMGGAAIVNGAHDQAAAAIGAGVFAPGCAVNGTGSVECLTPVFDALPKSHALYKSGCSVVPYIGPDEYVCYAFSFTGGAALKWYKDNFIPDESYERIEEKIPDAPSGLLLTPHFAGAATPYMDYGARAAIAGLTLGDTKYTVYRAVMEGVAYELLLNLQNLERAGISPRELYVTGGCAKSEKWLKIKADILGRPVIPLDAPEAGAMGTAMLAGVAAGMFKSLKDAKDKMVKPKQTVYPDMKMHERYMALYKNYKKLYAAARPLYAGRTDE